MRRFLEIYGYGKILVTASDEREREVTFAKCSNGIGASC